MPPLRCWINLSTLFIAVSFLFNLVVAVIGVKTLVSKRIYGGIVIVGLVLAMVGFYVAAKQDYENEQLRNSLETANNKLDKALTAKLIDLIKGKRSEIIERLRQEKNEHTVNFSSVGGGANAQLIMQEIAAIFYESGWKGTGYGTNFGIPVFRGIQLIVGNPNNHQAVVIQNVFKDYGIEMVGVIDPKQSASFVEIRVGGE